MNKPLTILKWDNDIFAFSVSTAAWDQLARRTGRRWPGQAVLGADPVHQDTGPTADEITLSGKVYPHWRAGLATLDRLRDLVRTAGPALLVTGEGAVMGHWILTNLDVTARQPVPGGSPLRQDFRLGLKYYGERPPQPSVAQTPFSAASPATVPNGVWSA